MQEDESSKGLGMTTVIVVFVITAMILISVFRGASWRAENELLPRYCDAPEKHLELVRQILTKETPAEGETRRPYLVAAKLIYIIPREDGESVDNYIARLNHEITRSCR